MAKIPLIVCSVYKIVEIPAGSAEFTEQLGTKFKFWYSNSDGELTLFKEGRPGTGENWAEKIACELAELLDLPHATYELASYEGKNGVISPTIVNRKQRLIHGNELLATFETDYEKNQPKSHQRREHTIRRVLSYFRASSALLGAPFKFVQTDRISSALDVFIGYLMFDAWIANQDRHDQNWGVIRTLEGNNFLAPSFDHGSSMGRNERDERRALMMTTKDMGQHITKYVTTARSAIFPNAPFGNSIKALTTLDAYLHAARQNAAAAQEWCDRLSSIRNDSIAEIINGIPDNLITKTTRRFVEELLTLNRNRILRSGL